MREFLPRHLESLEYFGHQAKPADGSPDPTWLNLVGHWLDPMVRSTRPSFNVPGPFDRLPAMGRNTRSTDRCSATPNLGLVDRRRADYLVGENSGRAD